jgi:hypothetical protein
MVDRRCAITRTVGAVAPHLVHGGLQRLLVLRVEVGDRLVEDQDRRAAQEGPRDRGALPLAAGQPRAALAADRLVTLRQCLDEVMRLGESGGAFDLVLACVRTAEPESQPHKHIGNNITVTYLAEVLRAGVSAGAWRLDDPDFTALFLFHALHGSVHDAAARPERLNRARLVRTIETLFFRVVGLC